MKVNHTSSSIFSLHAFRRYLSLPSRSGLFLVCIALLLISCASTPSSNPLSVVQGVFESLNKADIDGYVSYYADDAVMCSPGGCFHGTEEIKAKMGSYMQLHRRFEISDMKANGNEVTYVFKGFEGDRLVESANDGLFVVLDGKVIFDGSEALRTKECKLDSSQAFCP